MKVTRIGLIIPEPPFSGGVSSYAQDLLEMSEGGFEFVIFVQPPQNHLTGMPSAYGRARSIVLLPPRTNEFLSNASIQLFLMKNLVRICRQEGIDLIHSQFGHMPDLMVKARSSGIPIVSTAHNSSAILAKAIALSGVRFSDLDGTSRYLRVLGPAIGMIERGYARDRYLLCPSIWMMDRLRAYADVEDHRLFHVPHGIDTGRFRPIPGRRWTGSRRTIVFLGRFSAVKGIDVLLSAISALSIRLKLRLVMVGPGHLTLYDDKLEYLRRQGVEVECIGAVNRDKVPQVLCSADIAISSSYVENSPLSVMEAMSCGVPVVASNVGGIPEMLDDGKNGLLFQVGDSIGLAETALLLLEDEDFREQMALEARRTALEKFDGKIMGSRTGAVYESILSLEGVK